MKCSQRKGGEKIPGPKKEKIPTDGTVRPEGGATPKDPKNLRRTGGKPPAASNIEHRGRARGCVPKGGKKGNCERNCTLRGGARKKLVMTRKGVRGKPLNRLAEKEKEMGAGHRPKTTPPQGSVGTGSFRQGGERFFFRRGPPRRKKGGYRARESRKSGEGGQRLCRETGSVQGEVRAGSWVWHVGKSGHQTVPRKKGIQGTGGRDTGVRRKKRREQRKEKSGHSN